MCNFWVGVHIPDYTQHWGFFSVLVLIWAVQGNEPMVNPSQWHSVCCAVGGELFWLCLRRANRRWHSAHCQWHHQCTSRGKCPSLKSSLCILLSCERGLWTLLKAEAGHGAGVYTQQLHLVQADFSSKPPRADSFMESPRCCQGKVKTTSLTPAILRKKTDVKTERGNTSLRMRPPRFCWHPSELNMAMAMGRAELLPFVVCLPL